MVTNQKKGGPLSILKGVVNEVSEDNVMTMAASIAYYTIFSLPPLLVLVMRVAGTFADPADVQQAMNSQVGEFIGPEAGRQVQTMLQQADNLGGTGIMATILGIGGILIGATGAFAALQQSLNKAWDVLPDPEQTGLKMVLRLVIKRLFSLGMILVVAFLLLVSFVISSVISVLGEQIGELLPGWASAPLLQGINQGVSFAVITVLFSMMFKILPDARIAWKDVFLGGAVTAALFVLGKFLIGFYIGRSDPGSAFGAAASLAVILVWIYYSAVILLIGAEFTQVWSCRHGKAIQPSKHAVRVVEEVRYVRDGREQAEPVPERQAPRHQ